MKVIITEKPSMSKKYREALKDQKDIIVTNSIGHIETLADITYYLKDKLSDKAYWTEIVRHLPFVPEKFKHTIKEKDVFAEIIKHLESADEIILACDPDREGELIHRNIIEIAREKKKVKTDKITRIWLHSETAPEIQKAFRERKPCSEYEGYYQAARTRETIDWLIGIQLTILYSVKYGQPGKPLSLGRVQSWLLAEIVKRYLENKNFVEQPFWTIYFKTVDNVFFKLVDETMKEKQFFVDDYQNAKNIMRKCEGKNLFIKKIVKKPFIEYAPALYDLKSLQKDAARIYKISPDDTLKIAQNLYEKYNLISYPRTDCDVLSQEEAKLIGNSIELIGKFPEYANLYQTLKKHNPGMHLGKKYIGELQGHYAIIPVLSYDKDTVPALPEYDMKIFDLIVKRLAGALLPPAKGENTEMTGIIEENIFLSKFKNYTDYGYKNLINTKEVPEEGTEEDKPLSVQYQEEQSVLGKINEKQDKTKPEPLYNDASILGLMENAHYKIKDKALKEALKEANGIGTAATRASYIPLLTKRGYITKEKAVFIPTEIGISLDKILPEELKIPDYSAALEFQLSQMIKGKETKKFDDLVKESGVFLKSVFAKIENTAAKINMDSADTLGKCPKCGKEVVEREKTYSCTDKECGFVLWKKYAEAKLTAIETKNILKEGITKKALKMKSKEGREFEAKLKLNSETWKLEFVFEDKKESPKQDKKPEPKTEEKKNQTTTGAPATDKKPLSDKQLFVINKNAPEDVKKKVAAGDTDAGRAFLEKFFKK